MSAIERRSAHQVSTARTKKARRLVRISSRQRALKNVVLILTVVTATSATAENAQSITLYPMDPNAATTINAQVHTATPTASAIPLLQASETSQLPARLLWPNLTNASRQALSCMEVMKPQRSRPLVNADSIRLDSHIVRSILGIKSPKN